MKKMLKKICPECIHSAYTRAKYWLRFHLNPKGIANELHKALIGDDIDWKNPRTLNEKINWMKFNYDTTVWTRLADKHLVREYVKERIGEDALPKEYAVWDSADKIDFSNLPKQFVLKTNHGCHSVVPILDKNSVNIDAIKKQFEEWMGKRYGYDTIEPHYLKIKPLVYAEEFLTNDSTQSKSIIDYKVFCINGKAKSILVCTDRVIGVNPTLVMYDIDWNLRKDMLAPKYRNTTININKPECLQTLLDYAESLAKGHPQVRVDFYIVEGKVIFGEMTFTSQGGYMDYLSKDYSLELGKMMKI